MKYRVSKDSKMAVKISLLKHKKDEASKFLRAIYKIYHNKMKKEHEKMATIEKKLKYNHCILVNDLEQWMDTLDKTGMILCFTNSVNAEEMSMNAHGKKLTIPLIVVNEKNLKKLNVERLMHHYHAKKIFCVFDIDQIEFPNNWEIAIQNNIEHILECYTSYSDMEILENTEKITQKCVTTLPIAQSENMKRKWDVCKIIRKIDNTFLSINEENMQFVIFTEHVTPSNVNVMLDLSKLRNTLIVREKKERNSHIYDLLCTEIEESLKDGDFCVFENNQCIARRDRKNNKAKWPKNDWNGCCYDIEKKENCKYLHHTACDIQCISCRIFTCRYLKDRGFDYDIRKNIQVKCFLNVFQIPVLIWNFFTPKEVILKSLNKCNVRSIKKHFNISRLDENIHV